MLDKRTALSLLENRFWPALAAVSAELATDSGNLALLVVAT